MGKIKNGYTPIFDCIKNHEDADGQFGHVTALVFGIIWRVCEFKDRSGGVVRTRNECYAGHKTIAEAAATSSKTVQRHVNRLLKAGFIKKIRIHEKYRTPVYAIGERVHIENMVASIVDRESTIEKHGGQRVQGGVDTESIPPWTESPPIETSSIDTSKQSKKSLGETDVSPPIPFPSFEYDTLDEISHLDVNGFFVWVKLKGETEFSNYPVVGVSEKRIKLQIGNEADTIKYYDPEKIQAVYENGSFKRVVLGQKQSALCETGQAINQDLKELFTVSKVASETTSIRHYARLKEVAMNACNKGYGPDTVKMWEYWGDQTRPELSGTRSEQLTSFEKTLDIAHAWAVENKLIKTDPLQSE